MARGGGEEDAKKRTTRKPAIVLDTNIIISSLIKPGGFTRKIIPLLEDKADLYVSKALLEELTKKTEYLAWGGGGIPRRAEASAHPTPIKRLDSRERCH